MNLPLLKVGFVDHFPFVDIFFTNILSKKYTIIRDDINPDYLFFCDEFNGTKNLEYNKKNNIKIFYTGENRNPGNYNCHFAITHHHYDSFNHYRLPYYVIDGWITKEHFKIESYNIERSIDDIKSKKDFCGFVVSNPTGEMRNNFFNKLNQYKKIDSAGPLFNNVGYMLPKEPHLKRMQSKKDFLYTKKFTLAFENTSVPGYVTEKLPNAYYMKTIPIYWGAPDATTDFNPKCFLNWHDYLDDDKLIKKIIELDRDNEQYLEMYMQPLYYNGNSNRYEDLDRFLDWFDKNIYKGQLSNLV